MKSLPMLLAVMMLLIFGCEKQPKEDKPKPSTVGTKPQPPPAEENPLPDVKGFRQVLWGATFEEVEKAEGFAIPRITSGESGYKNAEYALEWEGIPVLVHYEFIFDELVKVTIMHQVTDYENPAQYIDFVEEIHKKMCSIYGHSKLEKRWTSRVLADEPKYHGIAHAKGDLWFTSKYETPSTESEMRMLHGPKHSVLVIQIRSRKHQALLDSYDLR